MTAYGLDAIEVSERDILPTRSSVVLMTAEGRS
jgi:hypothetical protein